MKKKLLVWIIVLLICCVLSPYGVFAAGKSLIIASLDNRPLSIDKFVYTALKDIGIDTYFEQLSLQSGYEAANRGEIDGVIASTPNMTNIYSNLMQIPNPVTYTRITAFTRGSSQFEINAWEDLEGLKVGILSNRIYISNQVPSSSEKYTSDKIENLMEGLADGTYDAVVLLLRDYETIGVPDGVVSSPFEVLPEYLYLNKIHTELASSVGMSIKSLNAVSRGENILMNTAFNADSTQKNILHIVSFNMDTPREQRFTAALRDEFANDESINWHMFEFNSGRYKMDRDRRMYYANLIRQEYLTKNITAVIVSGDDAFEFVREYYFLLFKNVTVLYYNVCETHEDETALFKPYSSGITHRMEADKTIFSAISLFPHTKNIYVINDYTAEGIHRRNQIDAQIRQTVSGVNIIHNENIGIKQLTAEIEKLPADSLVLVGSYFRDGNGEYQSQSELKRIIANNCSVPIFTVHSTDLEYSAIGGKVPDYSKYAEVIADMLRQVFSGTNVSDIPIHNSDEYNRWVFNKDLLDKFGINEKSLPPGSEVINKVKSIWESNPDFAAALIGLFAAGIAIAVVLSVFLTIYRKQKELLKKDINIKKVKEQLERTVNSAPISFMISVDGKIAGLNEAMKKATGLAVGDYTHSVFADPNERYVLEDIVSGGNSVENHVTKYKTADGEIRRCFISLVAADYEGKNAIAGWLSDIEFMETQKDELLSAHTSLQLILDTLPVPVRVVDFVTEKVVYMNNSCLELFEFDSSDEGRNTPLFDLMPEYQNDGTPSRTLLKKIEEVGEPLSMELEYITAKGNVIDTYLNACHIIYNGRKASIGIIRDFADVKALRAARESLQLVLDAMQVPVRIVEMETEKIIYMNKSCTELFEIDSAEDGYSMLLPDMMPEYQSDGTPSVEKIARIKETSEPFSMEVEYLTAKGNIIETLLNACHIIYNGSRVSIGIIMDFADVKKLAKTQKSLQAILDTMPVAIRIANIDDGEVTYGNKAALEIFGYSSFDEIAGRTSLDFMPLVQPGGANTKDVLDNINRLEYSSADLQCVKPSGETFDVRVSHRVIDYKGKLSSLAVIADLTAEKEYHRMLVNTAEKEKEANQLKSRFLVNMSHEIRTPMNAIIGLTEIELRKELESNVRDIYKKINVSAKNLLTIINDILDMSKIEADKIELYEEEIELEEVLSSALLVAQPRLEGKNVEFVLNTSLDLPRFIRGDRTRLWQILKNFLDNSAKYTNEGKIVLAACENSRQSDEENICITFMVKDTGIGMTDEQSARLFVPYFQIYNEAQKKYTGTGLGMAISKQLCELMGGVMQIDSEYGKGTSVTINIPFKRSQNTSEDMCIVNPGVLKGVNILAVDDDEVSLSVMSNLVTGAGAVCETAKCGEEALKIIIENRERGKTFDLILLDYLMEGINGIETAGQIQAALSEIPKLLMVTSYQRLLLKGELEKSHIGDLIEKPYIPSRFIGKIAEILGRGDIRAEEREEFIKYKDVRVLLCEDYFLNCEVAVGMFEQFGIVSEIAENGKEGVELLNSDDSFDIVFMDLQMPVMNGYEAARAIRADKRFDKIPIISLTADAMKEVVDKCRDAGMDDYIAKPIDFAGLNAIFLKWLPESKRILDETGTPEDNGAARFGSKEMYYNALRGFAVDLPDKWQDFSGIISDIDKAKRYMHKIKGAAGNLDETDIYRLAGRFCDSLEINRPDKEMYHELIEVCNNLKKRMASV